MGILRFLSKKKQQPDTESPRNTPQYSDNTMSAKPLTTAERQSYIKEKITAQVRITGCNEIVYCSEWLGYLPYGLYHWINCNDKDFTREFPSEWTSDDLLALEKTGFLEKINYWRNPDDEYDCKTTYKVNVQNDDLISVLVDTRNRLFESEDSVYANRTSAELIALIDENLKRIKFDGSYNKKDLDLLYAPTGSLQDTAIDNGWGQEFLGLTFRYDKAIGN